MIPLTDEKRVQTSPIAFARRFISATNLACDSAARSASAIAASLPDGSSSPYSSVRTWICLPRGSSPTPDPV